MAGLVLMITTGPKVLNDARLLCLLITRSEEKAVVALSNSQEQPQHD
jgi:hypothetical protein